MIGSVMVQMMACRLVGTKPLSKLMLIYFQLDPSGQISVNFNKKNKVFIRGNAFENAVCDLAVILSLGDYIIPRVHLFTIIY